MARTVKAKGGRTLTDAAIERPARQAEQGFDLSRWRPCRGRPSLSAAEGGRSPRIQVRVTDDLSRRATKPVAAEGNGICEVVRELLAGYAEGRHLAAPRRRRSNRPYNCAERVEVTLVALTPLALSARQDRETQIRRLRGQS